MPLTNAERQARYRARQASAGAGRLTIWLHGRTKNALDMLAARRGVSQSRVIASLIASEFELDCSIRAVEEELARHLREMPAAARSQITG